LPVTAWLLIALAVNVPMLYAGRVVAGFCVGIVSLCFPVYLGETLQPEVRGMLGLLPTALGNVGKSWNSLHSIDNIPS
jgi:facilitated trehalose transporter